MILTSPLPSNDVLLTVLMLVPETRAACNPVTTPVMPLTLVTGPPEMDATLAAASAALVLAFVALVAAALALLLAFVALVAAADALVLALLALVAALFACVVAKATCAAPFVVARPA